MDCFDTDFAGKADWKRAYKPEMYRENIAESLRSITGQSFGADPESWKQWWRESGSRDPSLK